MTWTLFWDMHSGGGTKESPFEMICIEAPEDEAKVVFFNRFGHSPERVSCTCCGQDYSIYEESELWILTAHHRNCKTLEQKHDGEKWVPEQPYEDRPMDPGDRSYHEGYRDASSYLTLEQYIAKPDVLVIRADEIKPEERTGSVPEQGYVWMG
jgi:hypothetical protein